MTFRLQAVALDCGLYKTSQIWNTTTLIQLRDNSGNNNVVEEFMTLSNDTGMLLACVEMAMF